jgi:hypothetical protein
MGDQWDALHDVKEPKVAPVQTLAEQVKDLKERVKHLESKVGGLDQRTMSMVRLRPTYRSDNLEPITPATRRPRRG